MEELVALASDFLGVLRTYDQALAAVVQGILLGDVNDQLNEATTPDGVVTALPDITKGNKMSQVRELEEQEKT